MFFDLNPSWWVLIIWATNRAKWKTNVGQSTNVSLLHVRKVKVKDPKTK